MTRPRANAERRQKSLPRRLLVAAITRTCQTGSFLRCSTIRSPNRILSAMNTIESPSRMRGLISMKIPPELAATFTLFYIMSKKLSPQPAAKNKSRPGECPYRPDCTMRLGDSRTHGSHKDRRLMSCARCGGLTVNNTFSIIYSMKRTNGLSTLESFLLGILDQNPCSGYDLRKQFISSPFQHFSDSPGSIYPALRRLTKWAWIEARRLQEKAGVRHQQKGPRGLCRLAATAGDPGGDLPSGAYPAPFRFHESGSCTDGGTDFSRRI